MSLIVDMLKKLNKDKEVSDQIPPSLRQSSEKRKSFLPYLIGLFIIVTLSAGVFVYYISTLSYENVVYEHPKINDDFQAKSLTSNNEKAKDENVNINKIKTTVQNQAKDNIDLKESKSNQSIKKEPTKSNLNKENLTEKPLKILPPIKSKPVKSNANNKVPPPKIFTEQDYINLLNQANLYLNKGNYNKAIKVYEKILKYKNDSDVLNNLLVLYAKTGQENEILNYLNKIDENVLLNVTLELINLGRIKEAEKILSKASQRGINSYLAYAILYEKSGYLEKALNYYEMAYKTHPQNPIYGYYYARALELNGKYKKAYIVYKNILNIINNKKLKNIIKNRIEILETYVGG